MDHCSLSRAQPTISVRTLPSPAKHAAFGFSSKGFNRAAASSPIPPCFRKLGGGNRRGVIVAARYNKEASSNSSSSLNTPLEPSTPAGRLLGRIMLDDPEDFERASFQQLYKLAIDRCQAYYKITSSKGDDEKCLNRRIFELRTPEWQIAAEDIMYMSVLNKFRKIGVHLTPKLSSCIYNHRLEISTKDWELESIHSSEVRAIIKEHLKTPLKGLSDSNVKESWAITRIELQELSKVYETSILYGYFLKSVSLKHHLEKCFGDPSKTYRNPPSPASSWLTDITDAEVNLIGWICCSESDQGCCKQGKTCDKLMCYIMELDHVTVQMCGKPRTKEAYNLIKKHTCALFMDEKMCSIQGDEVIVTSVSSLKRMVMEGIALGSFLWDIEDYVDEQFKLTDNC